MLRIAGISLLILMVLGQFACGGGSPGSPSPASGSPPSPNISISPTGAVVGSPDVMVTITGSNFVEGPISSQVVWSVSSSSTFLATTFISGARLAALVPAALLMAPVTAKIFVRNWDHIENVTHWTSDSVIFSVTTSSPGHPLIASLSPTSAVVGSPDLTLAITGSNFVPTDGHEYDVVAWSVNGSETFLTPITVVDTQITVILPAVLLSTTVNAGVRIEIRDYRDFPEDPPHAQSNSVTFNVTSAPRDSSVSSSSETRAWDGSSQFWGNPDSDWNQIAMDARIYAGLHYRHSLVEGFRLGHEVAEQISHKFFLLLPGRTKPKFSDD